MVKRDLNTEETEFLSTRRVGRLATVSQTNAPQVTPVCYAIMDECLYIRAAKETMKVKNVRNNPNVAMVVDDYHENWSLMKGMVVAGLASILMEGEEYRRARDALVEKYEQYRKLYPIVETEVPILKI